MCLQANAVNINFHYKALKNSVGVLPVYNLKCLLKVDLVLKPQS